MEKSFDDFRKDASMKRALQMLKEVNPESPYVLCYVGALGEGTSQILQSVNGTPKDVANGILNCLQHIGVSAGHTVNDMRMKFKVAGEGEEPETYSDMEAAYLLLAAAALNVKGEKCDG